MRLSSTLRALVLLAAVTPAAYAADPPPAPAPTAAKPAPAAAPAPAPSTLPPCPSGQRCGDRCIDWTAVCTQALRDSLGIPAPQAQAPGAAPPAGSTLLHLPTLREGGPPGMDPNAPPWCAEPRPSGVGEDRLPIECVPYYSMGQPAGGVPADPAACPQHLRCGGRCLAADEVCADAPGVDPAPAGPYPLTPQPVWR